MAIDSNELYDIADYTLDRLKGSGADGADVSVTSGMMDELNLDAGKFSLMRTTFSKNLAIRALSKSRKGAYQTNKIDRQTADAAVGSAIAAAESSEPDEAEVISDAIGEHIFEGPQNDSDKDLIYDRMVELMDQVKQDFPKVEIMQFIVQYNVFDHLFANSSKTRVLTKRSMYSVDVAFSARDGDKTTSFNGSGYCARDLDKPILSYPDLLRLISGATGELDAKPVNGKFTGVLLCSPNSLSGFLSEVLGNCVGGGAIIAGTSPWKDKLGQLVADRRIDISFAPHDRRIINVSRLQDGYLAYNQDIIKEGKLTAFALSEYAALKTGFPRAGATSGMMMAAGDMPVDAITAGIGRGILINRFSGGRMAPNGDFSGVAKNSFLIEDGKIAGAVAETMVSGNMLDMLQNVLGVSSEQDLDGNTVVPWAAFNGVTISGN